jgi:hypothetical protein
MDEAAVIKELVLDLEANLRRDDDLWAVAAEIARGSDVTCERLIAAFEDAHGPILEYQRNLPEEPSVLRP